MKTFSRKFSYHTKKCFDFIDVTEDIKKAVEESNIKNGLVNIQILHTSASLIVNENEPLLLEDIASSLEKMAPSNLEYKHDDFSIRTVNVCAGECKNGHSHCKAILLLPSVTLNLIDKKVQFGRWQRVMLVELDRARPREIQVQVIGG